MIYTHIKASLLKFRKQTIAMTHRCTTQQDLNRMFYFYFRHLKTISKTRNIYWPHTPVLGRHSNVEFKYRSVGQFGLFFSTKIIVENMYIYNCGKNIIITFDHRTTQHDHFVFFKIYISYIIYKKQNNNNFVRFRYQMPFAERQFAPFATNFDSQTPFALLSISEIYRSESY